MQADLNLRLADISEGTFPDVAAHFFCYFNLWFQTVTLIVVSDAILMPSSKWAYYLRMTARGMCLSFSTGPRQAKKCFRTCAKIQINLRMRKVSSGLYSPFIHSVVSNDSVSGKRMLWSDCADAQAGLGLRCPHMPEDTFSHGTVQPITSYPCLMNKKIFLLDRNALQSIYSVSIRPAL